MAETPLVGVDHGLPLRLGDDAARRRDARARSACRSRQRVVSAHRTPDLLFEYAAAAEERGLEVIIAGAGGAAHLPGMAAAKTALPVLGVPVESKALNGHRLAALDRADAGRHPGRHARDRPGRRGQRGAARGGDPRALATRRPGARSRRSAPRRRSRVLDAPDPRVRACVDRAGVAGDARRLHRRRPARADARRSPGSRSASRSASSIRRRTRRARRGRRARRRRLRRPEALGQLAAGADVVTYEFENVPVERRALPSQRTSTRRRRRSSCAGPPRREAALRAPRHPDRLRVRAALARARGCRRSSRRGGSATTARASGRVALDGGELARGDELIAEELVALRPRAVDPRRARPRRRDPLLPLVENVHRDGILRTSRSPRRPIAAARRRRPRSYVAPAARGARLRRRARARALRGRTAGCSRTSSRRASTTPATGRSRAR